MCVCVCVCVCVLFKEVKFEIFSVACCKRMKSLELHICDD